MENSKIYIPAQVSMLMPSDMYKVMTTLTAFQKEGIISYSRRNAQFLHLDEAIADQAIQTAINYKIIEPVSAEGGVYRFKLVQPTLEAAKLVQLTDIPNKPLLKPAESIEFKETMKTKQPSNEELLEKIRQLQAQLMTQVKENNDTDSLPW